MRTRSVFACKFVLLTILGFPLGSQGLDYPQGYKFTVVPDPLSGSNPVYPLISRALPAPGKSFFDPQFGKVLTRAVKGVGVRHEYSRFDPFNMNHSMIILPNLTPGGEWMAYRTNGQYYNKASSLIRRLHAIQKPRWDGKSPNLNWALRRFSIIKINVKTVGEVVVKDFKKDGTVGPIIQAESDLFRVTTKEEREASLDKRFWALY
jgi:hypothetical protein